MIRRRVVVSGHVQGVWFRDTCRREALSAGVSGWVSNRPDGRVEAVFEGEQAAVDRLVSWAHRGPQRAQVSGVETYEEPPEGLRGFSVS